MPLFPDKGGDCSILTELRGPTVNITTPLQYIKPSDVNRCGVGRAIVLGQWWLLISRSRSFRLVATECNARLHSRYAVPYGGVVVG